MKNKLIGFPIEVLEALDEYRKKTGIAATDYIRDAVVRRMFMDELIRVEVIIIKDERKE